jgi:hypothetical protein
MNLDELGQTFKDLALDKIMREVVGTEPPYPDKHDLYRWFPEDTARVMEARHQEYLDEIAAKVPGDPNDIEVSLKRSQMIVDDMTAKLA